MFQTQLSARQGAGMCQISNEELIIVGGFNGKFLSDFYTIQLDQNNGQARNISKHENNKVNQQQTLFPFQVPTVGDPSRREAYSIDWQNMALYQFRNNQWTYLQHVKNQANF